MHLKSNDEFPVIKFARKWRGAVDDSQVSIRPAKSLTIIFKRSQNQNLVMNALCIILE